MMVEIKKFYLFNKIRINSHLVAISFTKFLNDIPFFPKQKFFPEQLLVDVIKKILTFC